MKRLVLLLICVFILPACGTSVTPPTAASTPATLPSHILYAGAFHVRVGAQGPAQRRIGVIASFIAPDLVPARPA